MFVSERNHHGESIGRASLENGNDNGMFFSSPDVRRGDEGGQRKAAGLQEIATCYDHVLPLLKLR